MMNEPKTLIGWKEWVTLPDLRVSAIKAKIDTGAKTSAIHAEELEYFFRKGREMVNFTIFPLQRTEKGPVRVTAEIFDRRLVRSSNGKAMLRPVIITEIEMAGRKWPIELTLANRDLMGFRMLIGREALRHRFLIDVDRSYVTRRSPEKRKPSSKGHQKGQPK